MKFTRYGSLQPQKQVRYGQDIFHAPPCKYGFYAFPYGYTEFFLLGATSEPSNSSGKSQWLKDDDGNRILDNDIWDTTDYDRKTGNFGINKKYISLLKKKNIKKNMLRSTYDEKDDKHYVTVLKPPKEFEYKGDIWHHLGEVLQKKQHLILEEIGSWVKTDMETYEYCLKRTSHEQYKDFKKDWGTPHRINGLKLYAKDHLEVFFEKIK